MTEGGGGALSNNEGQGVLAKVVTKGRNPA